MPHASQKIPISADKCLIFRPKCGIMLICICRQHNTENRGSHKPVTKKPPHHISSQNAGGNIRIANLRPSHQKCKTNPIYTHNHPVQHQNCETNPISSPFVPHFCKTNPIYLPDYAKRTQFQPPRHPDYAKRTQFAPTPGHRQHPRYRKDQKTIDRQARSSYHARFEGWIRALFL